MKKETVFITGIAGFIGFHLARRLLQDGFSVVGIDNFNDYYSPELKKDRAELLQKAGALVIEGDICNFKLLHSLVEEAQPQLLIHLAAQAGVRYSITNPQAYINANIQGFLSVLEVCRQTNFLRLIYASSSSVYGLNPKIPFLESDPTDSPANLYAATKKSNELMAYAYHHLYDIPMIGLRFFTVYGPWGRPDMAYFSFAQDIMHDKPIQVYSHGTMSRDFTYIDDIIDGITSAMKINPPYEIFNLGNNQPETTLTLISLLEQNLSKTAHKHLIPPQKGEVPITYASTHKSQKYLNFCPKTSLSQGIKLFCQWFLDYYPSL